MFQADARASIAPADDDELNGMAGALQRALQQRAKVIQPGESGMWVELVICSG